MDVVKALVEGCDARVDLTQGELFKEDYDDSDAQYESVQEKFFMDAYKNSMTPLHLAVILGYEEIMHYLIEHGANPNLQTKIKGYSTLHLAVLANKPEIVIELLTKTQANPYLPDFGGRTLQDMIEIYIPSYLESFKTLLDNLQSLKKKGLEEASIAPGKEEESLAGLARKVRQEDGQTVVATHYYNPDDERSLQGVGPDQSKIESLYTKQVDGEREEEENKENDINADNADQNKESEKKKFSEIEESEIAIESESKVDAQVQSVFGSKIARALIAVDWKYKEHALKVIYKNAEKFLDMANKKSQAAGSLQEMARACVSAVSLTCKEKVIKVFSISLQLLNHVISS